MTLLDPSPSELIDRLCILEIKIMEGTRALKSVAHFQDESDDIINALRNYEVDTEPDGWELARLIIQLSYVHVKLFDLTTAQKVAKDENPRANSDVLLSLRSMNHERYFIRTEIDKLLGLTFAPEKL